MRPKPSLWLCALLLNALLFTGCCKQAPANASDSANPTQRYLWVTGLNPDKADYYMELHADVWPGVQQKITECNIQNMSIHKSEIQGKLYLLLYLEYVGDDFDADMALMAADPETQRWWKETEPCQLPISDDEGAASSWSDTDPIYYQP